ncbi:hypothetical protein ACFQY5_15720 [Paeniroseomonas aquatica]|uniref:hypothetical protein n=1 Tax=Paeniroseomonas aquatica TaxID=373043 RepID=UPI00361052F9
MPQTDIGTSDRILAELRGWVEHETPTTDAGAVNGLLDRCQAELAGVGAAIERLAGRDGYGDTLIARTPGKARRWSSPGTWIRSGTMGHSLNPCPGGSRATAPMAPASTT